MLESSTTVLARRASAAGGASLSSTPPMCSGASPYRPRPRGNGADARHARFCQPACSSYRPGRAAGNPASCLPALLLEGLEPTGGPGRIARPRRPKPAVSVLSIGMGRHSDRLTPPVIQRNILEESPAGQPPETPYQAGFRGPPGGVFRTSDADKRIDRPADRQRLPAG